MVIVFFSLLDISFGFFNVFVVVSREKNVKGEGGLSIVIVWGGY